MSMSHRPLRIRAPGREAARRPPPLTLRTAAARLLLWSAVALAGPPGAAGDGGPAVCGGRVRLPAALGPRREELFTADCPEDAAFMEPVRDGLARRLRRADDGPLVSSENSSNLAEPPDCRHEVAVKMMWSEVARDDVEGTKVKDGVYYWGKLFRATPEAPKPVISYGVLREVSLHKPGLHKVGGNQFTAELHLAFKGMRGGILDFSKDHPDFSIVVPMALDWSWDAPRSPILDWLSRTQANAGDCDWSLPGILTMVGNGFRCPAQRLLATDLLLGSGRALHYSAGKACENTFVLTQAVRANGKQIRDVQTRIMHDTLEAAAYADPELIVVGSALRMYEAFSVFSRGELRLRHIIFNTVKLIGLALTVGAYARVKQKSGEGKLDVTRYVMDPWVQFNLKLDHWICYTASMLIPCISYLDGSINTRHGMPLEYQLALDIVFWMHMMHEVVMTFQVGYAIERLSYSNVCRLAVMSGIGLYHYYYHISFMFVAYMHGSSLWWWSAMTFFITNVGAQVVLFSIFSPPALSFCTRSFSVMHALWEAEMDEKGHAAVESSTRMLRSETGNFEDESIWKDSSIEGLHGCIAAVAEILQFVYKVRFCVTFGPYKLVLVSLGLSGFYLVSGMLVRYLPSYETFLSRVSRR